MHCEKNTSIPYRPEAIELFTKKLKPQMQMFDSTKCLLPRQCVKTKECETLLNNNQRERKKGSWS